MEPALFQCAEGTPRMDWPSPISGRGGSPCLDGVGQRDIGSSLAGIEGSDMSDTNDLGISRRGILASGAATAVIAAAPGAAAAAAPARAAPLNMAVSLKVNGRAHALTVDPRTTLLDALREHLHLTGTKKGCDHGQCGACTVLVNGTRINSCLSLALQHEGHEITTIEGLGMPDRLHPMQAA